MTSLSGGVCSQLCFPDNPQTTNLNEDTCPDRDENICANVGLSSGGAKHFCLRRCSPMLGCNECSPKTSCHPEAAALVGVLGTGVCMLGRCKQDSDCLVTTTTTCDTIKKGCPAGETCLPIAAKSTDGRCTRGGRCDLSSGLCAPHAHGSAGAEVGDTCQADTDCDGQMTCMLEFDEAKYLKPKGGACTVHADCCSGLCSGSSCGEGPPCKIRHRNGYCTIKNCQFAKTLTKQACPTGSACNLMYGGGVCQQTCDMTKADDCRGNSADRFGDYECRNWKNVFINGSTRVSEGVLCDFGHGLPCSTFSAAGLSCANVAAFGDPTNMRCRNLGNAVLIDPLDPTGLCFDDTASGPVTSPVDGGPTPDSGPIPDGGSYFDSGGDGGISTAFGEVCTPTKGCATGYTCIFFQTGATKGICTKTCPKLGATCTGAAPGVGAICLLQDSGIFYCAFMCKSKSGQAWICPSALKCDSQDTPPGSGQRLCVP
jgi:hypothetical protein